MTDLEVWWDGSTSGLNRGHLCIGSDVVRFDHPDPRFEDNHAWTGRERSPQLPKTGHRIQVLLQQPRTRKELRDELGVSHTVVDRWLARLRHRGVLRRLAVPKAADRVTQGPGPLVYWIEEPAA